MKKLLVATSALVAAGSAAALDVTLGGSITSDVDYDASLGTWSASDLVGDVDLTVSGESMGWTYGASLTAGGAVASANIGNAAFGSLTVANASCGDFVDVGTAIGATTAVQALSPAVAGDACLEWSTGASLMGFGLSAAMDLANAQGSAVVGLTGDLAGMSMAAEVVLSSNAFDAVLGTSVAGAGVSIEATGNLNSLSTAAYVAKVSTSAMGFDLGLTADGNNLGYSAAMGGLKFSGTAAGDFLADLGVEYSADLADGLSTTVSYSGESGDLNIETVLSF